MDYDDIYASLMELDFNSDFTSEYDSDWEEFDLSELGL
jgi:hypothetical protein